MKTKSDEMEMCSQPINPNCQDLRMNLSTDCLCKDSGIWISPGIKIKCSTAYRVHMQVCTNLSNFIPSHDILIQKCYPELPEDYKSGLSGL